MHNAFSAILGLIAPLSLAATISNATAAPPAKAAEDRYIATRDAAIEKISAIYDAGNADDAARKAEEAASADLAAQMRAILNEAAREGFGPAKLHIDTFSKGDEGFGMLDGLRFDAVVGKNGEKAGQDGADGKYVEPKAHIIVTSQTLFERWLRAHKEWWGNNVKNVPQQIGAALKDESFYTQAVSSGAAVVNFNSLPIAKPAGATFVHGMLAGRTQSDIPDAADTVFVSAIANGKVYVAYGSIDPKVQVPACIAIRASYNKKGRTGRRRPPVREDRQEGLRQIGKPAPERRGRIQALLRAERAKAGLLCGSNPAGAEIVFGGDGKIART